MSVFKWRTTAQTCHRWVLYRNTRTKCYSTGIIDDVAKQQHDAAPFTPTGWSPPTGIPAPPGEKPDIPFRVRRSKYHQLPIYTDYKNGRTRKLTKISKIEGDIVTMDEMLRDYLKLDHLHTRVDDITGSIEINGHHRTELRKWLKSLGF